MKQAFFPVIFTATAPAFAVFPAQNADKCGEGSFQPGDVKEDAT
jgi:hypothetical protein